MKKKLPVLVPDAAHFEVTWRSNADLTASRNRQNCVPNLPENPDDVGAHILIVQTLL